MKPCVLILCDYYLPGYRAGGPIRSISCLVESLYNEFDFKIITNNHDLGTNEPYAGIVSDSWCKTENAEVYYASKTSLNLLRLLRLINGTKFDIIYLNSFFSFNFSIKPILLRYLKLTKIVKTIIAPRGEFSIGALKLKWLKKRIYCYLAQLLGLYSNVIWQASSEFEKKDIETKYFNSKVSNANTIMIAPDIFVKTESVDEAPNRFKQPGSLNIIFLSRISPMKNLDGALLMLQGIQGDITFNIYGPAEDMKYLEICLKISSTLSNNIKVVYHGEIDHSQVDEVLKINQLFFLPTHGENFGHVILEALLAGCLVLLSDNTQWRNLESHGIGWDLQLDRIDAFRAVLEHCVGMSNDDFTKFSKNAISFGNSILNNCEIVDQNRNLFLSAHKN